MSITETLTADGETAEFIAAKDFRIHVTGTFGSGTLIVQEKINGVFEPVTGTEKTAAYSQGFNSLGVGGVYRFSLSGSSTPDIDITVIGPVTRDTIF
jgi:hypothetical protein